MLSVQKAHVHGILRVYPRAHERYGGMTTIDRFSVVVPADWISGPKQGDWAYEHYAALPDDGQRYEIIDGVLYMAPPSPTGSHQDSALRFSLYLFRYVEAVGPGKVRIAPFDVQLSPAMIVQPDILVVLNAHIDRLFENRMVGAPDLVVEITSPGTATYDRREKYDAYARAGVPEYWIADPHARTVELFVLEGTTYHSLGAFRGKSGLPSIIVPGIIDVRVEQFFV